MELNEKKLIENAAIELQNQEKNIKNAELIRLHEQKLADEKIVDK